MTYNDKQVWEPTLFQRVINCEECGKPTRANIKWMPKEKCSECLSKQNPDATKWRGLWKKNALPIDKFKLNKLFHDETNTTE